MRSSFERSPIVQMPHSDADLWTCPKCGEKFAGKNMWHSCGKFSLESLFQGCDPTVWDTYQALRKMALEVAPFHVIAQKSRICFQLRTRCAGGTPAKSHFRFSFLSREVVEHPRIMKIESFAPDQHGHTVRLSRPEDVDEQIKEWLRLSTEYGEQRNRRESKS
ncbi:MAG TPA: DUF5655 domain-containing protein [Fimbriimonadaceae bacterium]|nr:DUF5655 domain-containing protein [Fimbriimonadaceae bacterium]